MKNFLLFTIQALVLSCLSACSENEQAPAAAPQVTLEKGVSTPTSLSFTITPSNALACAYVVIAVDEAVPTDAEVIKNGNRVNAWAPSEKTVDGLMPGTRYRIIAVVSGEEGRIASASAEMETLAPDPIVLDRGSGKIYGSSNNVGVTLRGTVDGVDYELSLDLYDDSCKETGYLGAKTYEVTSATSDGSLNNEFSYLQKDNDQFKFISGTLLVGIVERSYSFQLDAVLNNGERFVGTFEGELDGMPIGEPAPDPIVLDRGSGKIYGSSNNVGVTLRGMAEGIDYEISLDLYDDSCKETGYLGAKTYTVSTATTDGSLNSEYSYLQKDNDQYKFVSGTLKVEIAEKSYSFLLDVELNNGERFVGTFEGELDGMPIE